MTVTRWAAAAAVPALLIPLLAGGPRAGTAGDPNRTCLVTSVPLYSQAMWRAAAGTSPEANVGIANWGSDPQNSAQGGPGTAKSAAGARQIATAEKDGTRILGYIDTNYGTSAAGFTTADIETQMTDWHSWYGVTKFFLDLTPTATTGQPYYAALKSWAAANISPAAAEWLNMGAYPAASSWTKDGAVIMDWEDSKAPSTPPGWVHNYPASRFAMIMNAVPDTGAAIAAAVRDIENAHAGAGFVTSDHTYQKLPGWSYWSTFAGDAAGPGCT